MQMQMDSIHNPKECLGTLLEMTLLYLLNTVPTARSLGQNIPVSSPVIRKPSTSVFHLQLKATFKPVPTGLHSKENGILWQTALLFPISLRPPQVHILCHMTLQRPSHGLLTCQLVAGLDMACFGQWDIRACGTSKDVKCAFVLGLAAERLSSHAPASTLAPRMKDPQCKPGACLQLGPKPS